VAAISVPEFSSTSTRKKVSTTAAMPATTPMSYRPIKPQEQADAHSDAQFVSDEAAASVGGEYAKWGQAAMSKRSGCHSSP
jgi:hypothetical protein